MYFWENYALPVMQSTPRDAHSQCLPNLFRLSSHFPFPFPLPLPLPPWLDKYVSQKSRHYKFRWRWQRQFFYLSQLQLQIHWCRFCACVRVLLAASVECACPHLSPLSLELFSDTFPSMFDVSDVAYLFYLSWPVISRINSNGIG